MSVVNDPQRQQMRQYILQYLGKLMAHRKVDVGPIMHKLEAEAFKKAKSVEHYHGHIRGHLESIKRRLGEHPDANSHAARAQSQSQAAAHAAHNDHVTRSLQAQGHVPLQNPNHASSVAHGSHISAQSYQRDSMGQTGGFPYFPGHHPTTMMPQQQQNYPASARPPGVQLGDPSQFMGVPQQQMHAGRNIGMQRSPPGTLDNFQQVPMYQRASHPNIGMGGIRPSMPPMQNLVQHSQPIPHHLPPNALGPPVYQPPAYPSMAAQQPVHGNVKLLQSSVPNIPLQQQPPTQIIAQGVGDMGHQKQLLDPMDKKSLEEKFLKKSSEMNAKYSRDISSILSEFMKLDESKRDPQFDKMFEQLKKYYQMLNPNDILISKITPDHYTFLCQLESKIPVHLPQLAKMQQELMKMRLAASQGLTVPPSYGSMLHSPFPQRQAAVQQPHSIGVPQDQENPAGKVPPRAEPRQAKNAAAGQSDRQKDSNPEVHKTASNRPNRKHTAQALVSMLAGMPPNKISQLQQDLRPLVNTHPSPPSNPSKGFFSAGDSGHNSMQPLRVESRGTAKFSIARSSSDMVEPKPTEPGVSESALHPAANHDARERNPQLERKRKRVQEAMGDSVIVTIHADNSNKSGTGDLLVVDWKDEKDESESATRDTERKDPSVSEQKTVPWKRLRMDVNLDAEYSDDAFPVALFSSQDSFYRSKKCVAARNLFRSKLPNTRSSVLSIVESWAASCNEIDRIFA